MLTETIQLDCRPSSEEPYNLLIFKILMQLLIMMSVHRNIFLSRHWNPEEDSNSMKKQNSNKRQELKYST